MEAKKHFPGKAEAGSYPEKTCTWPLSAFTYAYIYIYSEIVDTLLKYVFIYNLLSEKGLL